MKRNRGQTHKPLAACAVAMAIAIAALGAAAQGGSAKTPSATEIVDSVQAHYAEISDYHAEFVQTLAHKLFPGRLERSYGAVMFKKGGLMRWEYARPERKLFVHDGKTLWIYEPEVPQVFKATANAEQLRKALAFLSGEGKIKESYKAEKLDAGRFNFKDGYVLKLTPKEKGSPFKRVELYVDSSDFHVARSVVVDHEGNRNRFDFSRPAKNAGLAASLFAFTPPADVPVLEAAE
ncbi:MAG: outer membrane lipoprotein chaperone LolA [Proteobacteria bacterium]|jgi:outer membrane lipoprotein carrier protein|nr:outer membrane lipoprotein chaperone LolA [Pseudomonadota bacterium]